MENINLSKLNEIITLRKKNIPYINMNTGKDEFVLRSDGLKKLIDEISTKYSRLNFKEIMKSLKTSNFYTTGVGGIGYNINKNGYIESINLTVFDDDIMEHICYVLDHKDYIDFLTQLTAKQIEKHPECEQEYKKEYLELMRLIEQSRADKA